jgi:uncharacterized protein (DUF433 family)
MRWRRVAFYTDGASILYDYAQETDDEELLTMVLTGQRVFADLVRRYLQRVHFDSDAWARRLVLPITERPLLVVDPARGFGQPLFLVGGAPMEAVLERFRAGEPFSSVAEDFDRLALVGLGSAGQGQRRLARDRHLSRRDPPAPGSPSPAAGPARAARHWLSTPARSSMTQLGRVQTGIPCRGPGGARRLVAGFFESLSGSVIQPDRPQTSLRAD